jgi:hypothetical protein
MLDNAINQSWRNRFPFFLEGLRSIVQLWLREWIKVQTMSLQIKLWQN